MDLASKKELRDLREKLYQKARNYRINHIMEDLEEYNNDKLYGILNGESKFLWAAPKLSDLTGWSIYEIISMPLKRLIHKDDLITVNELYSKKENVDSLDIRVKLKNNGYKTINVKCNYHPDKNCVYCYEIN